MATTNWLMTYGEYSDIVWFQKISIPPPRRELEIPEGWGGQWPRKFQRGGGVNGWISFQRVNFTFMSDINVRRSFLKTLLCLTVLKKPLLHYKHVSLLRKAFVSEVLQLRQEIYVCVARLSYYKTVCETFLHRKILFIGNN